MYRTAAYVRSFDEDCETYIRANEPAPEPEPPKPDPLEELQTQVKELTRELDTYKQGKNYLDPASMPSIGVSKQPNQMTKEELTTYWKNL
jgi:hypothetical protein